MATQVQCPVIVALDDDDAGRRGWESFCYKLKTLGQDVIRRTLRVLPFCEGWECKDWNDVLRATSLDGVNRRNKKPAIMNESDAARVLRHRSGLVKGPSKQ